MLASSTCLLASFATSFFADFVYDTIGVLSMNIHSSPDYTYFFPLRFWHDRRLQNMQNSIHPAQYGGDLPLARALFTIKSFGNSAAHVEPGHDPVLYAHRDPRHSGGVQQRTSPRWCGTRRPRRSAGSWTKVRVPAVAPCVRCGPNVLMWY